MPTYLVAVPGGRMPIPALPHSHRCAIRPVALCDSRPHPRGYDETLLWKSVGAKRYVILRFDRFVFVACEDKTELEKAVATSTRYSNRSGSRTSTAVPMVPPHQSQQDMQ
ncbi:monooxygenase [Penicillium canariense]|uniref:Monooxygenase n=1 Tax=Penicillium canariense TaxID=189055 RepID=A0A9W9LSD2_9EURO|nr:monooxygenase [Penicillium canariense]KAJ5174260.1 monooxygenase [Penicillium canariense]